MIIVAKRHAACEDKCEMVELYTETDSMPWALVHVDMFSTAGWNAVYDAVYNMQNEVRLSVEVAELWEASGETR